MIAGLPSRSVDPYHSAERVGEVGGQLAAAAGAGEAGKEGAGAGTGVEAARLRVAERVLGEGGRGGCAVERAGVGERDVEPQQDGEGLTPAGGRRNGLTVADSLLDRGGDAGNLRIRHPGLALGVELSGVEPIEQLAEEIGVSLGHT